MTAGTMKNPKNVVSTFFNTVNLLPKDLSFKHGGTKLVSYPGKHLTSLRPCKGDFPLEFEIFSKNVNFLVLSGKKQVSLHLASP